MCPIGTFVLPFLLQVFGPLQEKRNRVKANRDNTDKILRDFIGYTFNV